MMLSTRDEDIIEVIVNNQRINIQAATYTVYVQMTPNNKKPISQREFQQKFNDNWRIFESLENER